jgi:hypothetical protein
MDLYTLTSRFFPRDYITEFTSVIWTERYSSAGDVQLVVPATPEMAEILAPGTFLGLRGTKEIMLLDKHSVEKGLLTVTGESLVKFLDERPALFKDEEHVGDTGSPYGDYKATTTAGQLICSAVYLMVINATSTFALDWAREKIVGLELGHVDMNGAPKPLSFPNGPLYSGIQSLATEEGVGFKLYLESAKYSTNTYVLKFATYRGRNRTSDQDVHGVVRLSPRLDSLTDVKEITSLSEYKNVVYVSYKNAISKHYINPDLPIPTGFERRSLFVEAPDLYFSTEAKIVEFLDQVARNELANHIYVQMVDGQVSPQIDYKFGDDYYLGDVVELQGFSGLFSKARITEYIRAQDQFGMKEYPTLAVLDPLKTGYLPDLEPNPENLYDFDDDSNFDLDIDLDDDGWDPDDETSGYDPEHDPNRRRKRRKRTDPYDPNPDPDINFGSEGNDPGSGGVATPGRAVIVTGYYPNQSDGEAIAYLEYGGAESPELRSAWKYKTEDPSGNAYNLEVQPNGWTLDHTKLIVRSREDKNSSPASPWSHGYAFWLKDPTQTDAIRMTETIPGNFRQTGPEFGETHGYSPPRLDDFWCESNANARLYLPSSSVSPGEYLYANGTYTHVGDPSSDDGVFIDSGWPVELFAAWSNGGTIANNDLHRILSRNVFPHFLRWSSFNGPWTSPDGTKMVFWRREISAPPRWNLSSFEAVVGGSFTITVGPVGNEWMSHYETAPIPYNATIQDLWEKVLVCGPLLQDPRLRGYPYQPYYLGSTPLNFGGEAHLIFDTSAPNGVWATVDNSGLEVESSFAGYQIRGSSVEETGPLHWFMCDYDGSNLEELNFQSDLGTITWSPDSSKIQGMTPSGHLLTYKVSDGSVSSPLDTYLTNNPDSLILGTPLVSPNGVKMAWTTANQQMWMSNVDGSNLEKLYEQTVDNNSTDQNALVLGYSTKFSWSFDSTKIAIIDDRYEAPVWLINLTTHTMAKIWPGTGWDNPDDQKWLYDIQKFQGG